MRPTAIVLASSVCLGGLACDADRWTNAEFRAAVDEVVLTGDADALQDGVVEITTSFTLAQGLEAVIEEVVAFLQSQAPCSTVDTSTPGTIVIDFGELADQCTYRGNTYAGVVTVSYEIGEGEVVVTHDYAGLTNGRVTLDGGATVTWAEASRHVQTDFAIEGEDRRVDIDSDRTQTLIGGIGDGIRVAGERNWHGARGSWHLDIDDVEMRGRDPVPQDGTYTLTNPDGKEMSMSFERIDDDTIEVVVAGGWRERTFHVSSAAEVSE